MQMDAKYLTRLSKTLHYIISTRQLCMLNTKRSYRFTDTHMHTLFLHRCEPSQSISGFGTACTPGFRGPAILWLPLDLGVMSTGSWYPALNFLDHVRLPRTWKFPLALSPDCCQAAASGELSVCTLRETSTWMGMGS